MTQLPEESTNDFTAELSSENILDPSPEIATFVTVPITSDPSCAQDPPAFVTTNILLAVPTTTLVPSFETSIEVAAPLTVCVAVDGQFAPAFSKICTSVEVAITFTVPSSDTTCRVAVCVEPVWTKLKMGKVRVVWSS